jgi:hypothetical protein
VPVPPLPPLRFVITTYYLFEGYYILGEVEVKEVKFLLNVQLDIEHFTRVKKIREFLPRQLDRV